MIRRIGAIVMFVVLLTTCAPNADALERPLWNREPAHWLEFDANGIHYVVHPSNLDPYKTIRSVER